MLMPQFIYSFLRKPNIWVDLKTLKTRQKCLKTPENTPPASYIEINPATPSPTYTNIASPKNTPPATSAWNQSPTFPQTRLFFGVACVSRPLTTFSIFPRGFRALGVLSRFYCIQGHFYPQIDVLTHFNGIQLNFDAGFEFRIKF